EIRFTICSHLVISIFDGGDNYPDRGGNCQRAKKFPLSGMYKIKAIEQKILSAKLKKISIKSGS
ncbi:hypothetical protein OSL19_18670, partial [Escherichia coli]|nr:hypothetical protein [Escherichia coli]